MVKLLPHQSEVLGRLKTGSILLGGVGSGKSMTALAYWQSVSFDTPLIVITTAMKRDTNDWNREAAKFGIASGTEPTPQLIVVDSWNNIKKYKNLENCFFIFDEQKVVGSGTWAKTFIKIAKHNKWILLTATPGDTWMDYIPVFVANGFYENRTDFIRQHVVYNTFTTFPKIDRYVEESRLDRLRASITVEMNYKPKANRQHFKIFFPYDSESFFKIKNTRWNIYDEVPVKGITEMLYLLRRCVNSDVSRTSYLSYLFSKHKRLIVFYSFDYELEILKDFLKKEDIFFKERNGHVHEDLPECGEWVYLVNYMSGAEGWNCITTDSIVFFSVQYSYKLLEQASGRIDRINSPFKTLNYYHFLSESWIDRVIMNSLSKKKEFNSFGREIRDYLGYD